MARINGLIRVLLPVIGSVAEKTSSLVVIGANEDFIISDGDSWDLTPQEVDDLMLQNYISIQTDYGYLRGNIFESHYLPKIDSILFVATAIWEGDKEAFQSGLTDTLNFRTYYTRTLS
jgi:hypothetical protein